MNPSKIWNAKIEVDIFLVTYKTVQAVWLTLIPTLFLKKTYIMCDWIETILRPVQCTWSNGLVVSTTTTQKKRNYFGLYTFVRMYLCVWQITLDHDP